MIGGRRIAIYRSLFEIAAADCFRRPRTQQAGLSPATYLARTLSSIMFVCRYGSNSAYMEPRDKDSGPGMPVSPHCIAAARGVHRNSSDCVSRNTTGLTSRTGRHLRRENPVSCSYRRRVKGGGEVDWSFENGNESVQDNI